jgi:hypothetical protein
MFSAVFLKGYQVAILRVKNLKKIKKEVIPLRGFFPASNEGGGGASKNDDRRKNNEECSVSIFRMRG